MSASIHFSFEDLADFVEGRLAPEATAPIEAHLATGCSICSDNVAFLRRVTRAMQAAAWPAPPRHIHHRSAVAFRRYFPRHSWSIRPAAWRQMLIAAMAVVIIAVGLVWYFNPGVAYAASLAEVAGPVEARLSSDAPWLPAVSGQTVPVGAEIRTLAGGQATVVFPGGDSVRLTSNTQLALTALSQSDSFWHIALRQSSGQTDNSVGVATSLDSLQTPAGEVGGTATRFSVRVEADDATTISVSEGMVTVTTSSGALDVFAYQSVQIVPGSRPVTLIPSTPTLVATFSPAAATALVPTPPPSASPSDRPGFIDNETSEITEIPTATTTPQAQQSTAGSGTGDSNIPQAQSTAGPGTGDSNTPSSGANDPDN